MPFFKNWPANMLLIAILFLYNAIPAENVGFSDEPTFFFSPNILTWRSANNYCRNICGSSLVSIHNNIRDEFFAKYVIENTPFINAMNIRKVWIGLYFSVRDNIWKWTDFTPTTNLSIGDFIPNDRSCVLMNIDSDFEWEIKIGSECDESAFFLCNHCDGKLIKYLLIDNQTATFKDSDIQCQSEMDTNLISIHNNNDYVQAKLLCLYGTNGDGECWIGLNMEQNIWNDGTKWDYGSCNNNNNNINASCAVLSQNEDYLCQKHEFECLTKKNIICSIPNELRYDENWESLYGEELIWNFSGWESVYKDKIIINTDKQWINNNGELVIEYVFNMNQINTHNGIVAISIYNFPETVCNYYSIGIAVEWNNLRLFLMRYYDNVHKEIYSVDINETIANFFYVLNIKIINGTKFDIKLNNVQYILFNDDNIFAQSDISGFIGLMNYNLFIQSKSLYVSGSPVFFNYDTKNTTDIISKFDECPSISISTTLQPTYDPTISSHKICINIMFEYDTNTKTNISNITQHILHIINDTNCVQTAVDVYVSLMDKQVRIKSDELVVCKNNIKQILTHYIQNIDGVSKLEISLNCSLFLFQSTTANIENIKHERLSYKFTHLYVMIVVGIFICCLFAFCIIYESNKSRNMMNEDGIKMTVNLSNTDNCKQDSFVMSVNKFANIENNVKEEHAHCNSCSQDISKQYISSIKRNVVITRHIDYIKNNSALNIDDTSDSDSDLPKNSKNQRISIQEEDKCEYEDSPFDF